MKPLTQEWLHKAAADYGTMTREFQVTVNPNFEAVCFHSQQCIEKLLKGLLYSADIAFPKTHDIRKLLLLALSIEPAYEQLIEKAALLTFYASHTRYPGETASREDATECVALCEELKIIFMKKIESEDQILF